MSLHVSGVVSEGGYLIVQVSAREYEHEGDRGSRDGSVFEEAGGDPKEQARGLPAELEGVLGGDHQY